MAFQTLFALRRTKSSSLSAIASRVGSCRRFLFPFALGDWLEKLKTRRELIDAGGGFDECAEIGGDLTGAFGGGSPAFQIPGQSVVELLELVELGSCLAQCGFGHGDY